MSDEFFKNEYCPNAIFEYLPNIEIVYRPNNRSIIFARWVVTGHYLVDINEFIETICH